jgi:hypothetical protein
MRRRVSQFRRFYAILQGAIYLQQFRCGAKPILPNTSKDFEFAIIGAGSDS